MKWEKGFVVWVSALNAGSFFMIASVITYVDPQLEHMPAWGARTYTYGYPVGVLGAFAIFAFTYWFLNRAWSWVAKAVVPTLFLMGVCCGSLPFFLPLSTFPAMVSWGALVWLMSLLTCYLHYLPLVGSWFHSEEVGLETKKERIRELCEFWRSLTLPMSIGYVAILLPCFAYLVDVSQASDPNPEEAQLLWTTGILLMSLISFYAMVGPIYQGFRRTYLAGDLLIELDKQERAKAHGRK